MTKPENLPALLAALRVRAHTEAILRDSDPYDDLDKGEASAWDKTVTPEAVLTLIGELERLQPRPGTHEFTGTVKRADGVQVTVTLTIPEGHGAVKPEPTRPWHGPDRTNQNFIELGEIAMMMAQRSYSLFENTERSRQHWNARDYWSDITGNYSHELPTQAIEAPKMSAEEFNLCECSEHYQHRGWHTPGCPADDGESQPFTGPGYDAHPGQDHEDCCK